MAGQETSLAQGRRVFIGYLKQAREAAWNPSAAGLAGKSDIPQSTVESLIGGQRTRLPDWNTQVEPLLKAYRRKEEIWDLPGFNAGDYFMGMRFLDAGKGSAVIDGLGIEAATSIKEATRQEQQVTAALVTPGAQIIDAEAVNTTHTSYNRPGGPILVHRAEALLVQRYRETLNGTQAGRIRAPASITDLYVVTDDCVEIIEAKRSADHAFFRQALGQLLDYAPHSPQQATRLTALFPSRPVEADVRLLHRYGIDCVHQNEAGVFVRLRAPKSRRDHMMQVWSGS